MKVLEIIAWIGMAVWALVMVWLFFLGFTTSFISDRFFWWELVSLAICIPSLTLLWVSTCR